MSLGASTLTAMGSVLTAGAAAGGGTGGAVTQIIQGAGISVSPGSGVGAVTIANTGVLQLTAGTGIAITGSKTNYTITATGSGFPGYGGAPPSVALASAGGSATTVSRSDHTHALDLVAYTPTLAGMQHSGVVQQTYATTTATPAVLTMTTGLIPFGLSSGLLSQDARLNYTAPRLGISSVNTFDPTNLNNGLFTIVREVGGSQSAALVLANNYAVATSASIRSQKARGTRSAPTIVQNGDFVSGMETSPYDGTNYILPLSVYSYVTATPGVNNVPMAYAIQVNLGGTNGIFTETSVAWKVDTQFNVYNGAPALLTTSTDGFDYWPGAAGPPTQAPTNAFGSTAAQNRVPHSDDTTNLRLNAYIGGAWHFTSYDDYAATATRIPFGGATAGTLSDSANLTWTSATTTLTVTGTIEVANGGINFTGTSLLINSTGGLQMNSSGNTTISASGAIGLIVNNGDTYFGGGLNTIFTSASDYLRIGGTGANADTGSLRVNTGTTGQSIGGGLTAGIYVADPLANGQANLAVDDSIFCQNVIGFQNLSLVSDLAVGCGPSGTLRIGYNFDRVGAHSDALTVDGSSGLISIASSLGLGATMIQAAGAVAVTISNAPTGAAATPKEYMIVKGTGGATRWIPMLGV